MSGKSKYSINEDIFDIDSEVGFYLAGFIAADGNVFNDIRSNTLSLNIGLSRKDKPHLIKIKEAMCFTGPISDHKHYNKKYDTDYLSSKLQIYCSKKIINDLERNFNVVPNKTFIYQFPNNIILHSMVRHFIRGYFDGDGSFYLDHANRNSSSMCFDLLGTKSFLETVCNILERDCNLQSKAVVNPIKNIYRLRYSGTNLISKIVNYLYKDATIYLNRKFDIVKHLIY
jgi:hypothetical protein